MPLRKRIGLIVPSTNTTCESDYQLVAPDNVTIHSHRLWLTDDADAETAMESMNAEIQDAAKYLGTASVDAVVYGCTTGSFYKGIGWDSEMVKLMQNNSGASAFSTSPSAVEALRFFGAKKVSVASPYPEWNNQKLREYLEASGFEVLNVEGVPWAGQQGVNNLEPESILEFATRVCKPEADAIFCSCTAWRSLEIIARLEERTGKPVVTANQSTIWASFRKLGIKQPIKGFGKLLESLSQTAP